MADTASPDFGSSLGGARPQSIASFVQALVDAARWKIAAAVGLTVAVAGASAVAALMLIPLVQAVGLDPGSGGRRLSWAFTAALRLIGQQPSVGWALVGLVVATALQTAIARSARVVEDAVEMEVLRRWRTRLFAELCGVEWAFYSRYRTSDLMEVMVEQVDRVGLAARTLLDLVASLTIGAAYLIVAVRISPSITAIALVAVGSLVAILSGSRRRTRRLGNRQVDASKDLYAVLMESFGAMKTIRAYSSESVHEGRLAGAVDRVHEVTRDLATADASARQIFDVGLVVTLGLVAYVALVVQSMPPAELFVLLFVFARVTPQMSSLHNRYQRLLSEIPAFERLQKLDAEAVAHADRVSDVVVRPVTFTRTARLDRVTFGYGPHVDAVREISLQISRGETVAVVGPSGAGKTTIADLMLGLLAPSDGRLLVDDAPLDREAMPGWRAVLGYVPQEGMLFHDSVRANLLWGNSAASDTDLRSALQAAAAWSFVSKLPRGIDTVVGDRGVLLSGGERQRLALARALVRQPQLLILDEATSSLDSENERLIEQAIDELHGRISILLITHRLTTVRRADVIYVLDAGRIVESGSWDGLLARRGRFHALCVAQGIEPGPLRWPRAVPGV